MNRDEHVELYHKCTDKVNMNGLSLDYTTPEQSKRLIELGIPIESANIVYYHTPDSWHDPYLITEDRHIENLKSGKGLPCWSVGRLIEIFAITIDSDFIDFDTYANSPCVLKELLEKYEKNIELLDFSKLDELI